MTVNGYIRVVPLQASAPQMWQLHLGAMRIMLRLVFEHDYPAVHFRVHAPQSW